jgi:hypothetical protein
MLKKITEKAAADAGVQDASSLDELKSSCRTARLNFMSASYGDRSAAHDAYVKAKSDLDNALAAMGKN